MMCHQCARCSLASQVEIKQMALRVLMVETAIKVKEHSSGFGWFFHQRRSPPARGHTCLSCGLTPRLTLCCKPLFLHEC